MSRSCLIVVNPGSGTKRGRGEAARLGAELRARGFDARTLETERGRNVFAEIEPRDYEAIVVVGGDGTFHLALNGLSGLTTPLGFLGTGTVNVLAREAGLPSDPAALADLVERRSTMDMPLFLVNGERRAALFVERGLFGEVVSRVNVSRARRGRHGRAEFVLETLRVLGRSFGRPVVIEGADGRPDRRFSNVLLTRARCYGGVLPMPVDRSVREPLAAPSFQVVAWRTAWPGGHFALLLLAALRALPLLAPVLSRAGVLDVRRASRIVIRGRGAVEVDAESCPDTDLSVEMAGSVRLFAPPRG